MGRKKQYPTGLIGLETKFQMSNAFYLIYYFVLRKQQKGDRK